MTDRPEVRDFRPGLFVFVQMLCTPCRRGVAHWRVGGPVSRTLVSTATGVFAVTGSPQSWGRSGWLPGSARLTMPIPSRNGLVERSPGSAEAPHPLAGGSL